MVYATIVRVHTCATGQSKDSGKTGRTGRHSTKKSRKIKRDSTRRLSLTWGSSASQERSSPYVGKISRWRRSLNKTWNDFINLATIFLQRQLFNGDLKLSINKKK
jgi:endonuclease YncB( thermonuclease family)